MRIIILMIIGVILSACQAESRIPTHTKAERAWQQHIENKPLNDRQQRDLTYGQE